MGYPPTSTHAPTLTHSQRHTYITNKQTNIKQNKLGLEPKRQCQDHSLRKTSPIAQMPQIGDKMADKLLLCKETVKCLTAAWTKDRKGIAWGTGQQLIQQPLVLVSTGARG